ncbi:gliding motility-associated C-terminal domain-containing protein [uncultured Hymenobacter sp.]|uniref:T9SS type B sorting domain-containing protein n=1 Tax=uncultured Hymenobacter sp. TaxID=170016 RepID=UPI0035C9AFA1
MINFSSLCASKPTGRGRWLAGLLTLLALLLSQPEAARATHIRAGDIQARVDTTVGPGFNPRRIFFKMTLYTDRFSMNGNNPVREDSVAIFFGDGSCTKGRTIDRAARPGGPYVGPTQITNDTDINYYYFEHTYPSSGQFTVSYIGENRNANVRNINSSIDKSFYIGTTFTIGPDLGRNRTPILTAPAVDKGGVLQVFLHNPAAFDPDGDSLAFKLKESQFTLLSAEETGRTCKPAPEIVTGFRYPNAPTSSPSGRQVPYNGPPAGGTGAAIFVQDPRTGQIVWNAPGDAGTYNVAFVVEEYRRTAQGFRKIGEVIRDMQIIISPTNNLRPTIRIPNDTCVIAGATVVGNVSATDGTGPGGQAPLPVVLSAFSGIIPPATFRQSETGPPTARGRFEWTTDCSNVASEPYLVLFKAQDTPPQSSPPQSNDVPPLIDERAWRITVVGPPPQNLQATAGPRTSGITAQLTWDAYACQSPAGTAAGRQVQMLIFRKEGCTRIPSDPCLTGLPEGSGYQQIGSVSANQRSFLDDRGLERGKTYSYRIYAVFPLPAGGESIVSQEACLSFDGRAAVLTNVDVDQTSTTAGQITVRWTKPVAPRAQGGFTPPFSYRLSRGEGQTPATFTVIAPAITNLADTVFVDRNLDTQTKQYTYRLEFLTQTAGQTNTEPSPTASSVRLTATPQPLNRRIVVSWTYQVPWDNTAGPTRVFRRNSTGGAFVQVGTAVVTAAGGTYTDADPALQLDQTYCYYVQTVGRYPDVPYLQSLLNKSQEQCVPLISEPCTPVLTVLPINCDSLAQNARAPYPAPNQRFENRLRWTLGTTPAGCSNENIRYYRIFVGDTEAGPFTLRDSTSQLSFIDRNLLQNKRCYQVQAVDAAGRRSARSNVACVDECQLFILPNIFTPNGDQFNNTFRPRINSPVRQVRFQVFNRWGVKVYENVSSTDPLINWDGGGARTESGGTGKVSDGIYYYLAEVEFADFKNTKRTFKGWVEIVR